MNAPDVADQAIIYQMSTWSKYIQMDGQNLKQEQLLQADKKLDGCKLIKKFGKGHITK